MAVLEDFKSFKRFAFAYLWNKKIKEMKFLDLLELTQVALSQQMLDIFILNLRVEPLAKECGIGEKLVVKGSFHRLYQLVLQKRVKY